MVLSKLNSGVKPKKEKAPENFSITRAYKLRCDSEGELKNDITVDMDHHYPVFISVCYLLFRAGKKIGNKFFRKTGKKTPYDQ
jgi:hypothetical protein